MSRRGRGQAKHKGGASRLLPVALVLAAVVAEAGDIADPMRPPTFTPKPQASQQAEATKEPTLPPLVLQMVVISPQRTYAVINNTPLLAGQQIEQAMLVDIRPREVTLMFRGETIELRLAQAQVVKPIRAADPGEPRE